jgi:DNA repair ATPase RecN
VILLLLALISATTAFQGDVVNLTLNEQATVTLDECMYFLDTLQNSSTLPPGEYGIKITHSCLGNEQIEIRTNTTTDVITIKVEKDPNPEESLVEAENEVLSLRKEVQRLEGEVSYYKKLFEVLNKINVDLYDKLQNLATENDELKRELELYKSKAGNYSQLIDELRLELSKMNETVRQLQATNEDLQANLTKIDAELSRASANLELFQTLFFVTLSFLVGSAFALMRR